MSEAMTPKERMGAFLTGQPIDRVPCVPLILNHAARVLGIKVSRHNADGRRMADAHVAAFRRYRQDMITVFSDTAIVAEAMGTVLSYPEDAAPFVQTPRVKTPADADSVEPPDPQKDGRLPVYLEAVRRINEAVGGEVFVGCCFAAPFTTAACLRGTDVLARDLIRNPELAHRLLEVSLEAALRLTRALAAAGAVPVLVDPVASGSVLSPKQFRDFVAPYTKPALDLIRELGFPPIYHICGKTHLILEAVADLQPAVVSLDRVSLGEAKRRIGDRVCLMGNVKPTETLLQGTPADVEREARACLEAAADSPRGFILASGCEVPVDAPAENVFALLHAADQYGSRRRVA